jgi:photosystem II stability/assembly factor-like uncharacterized protein
MESEMQGLRRVGLLTLLLLIAVGGARRSAVPASAQTPAPSPVLPAAPLSPAVLNNLHYQAALAFYAPRVQGLAPGDSYNAALSRAVAQRLALPKVAPRVNGAPGVWTNLGPNPVTNGQIGNGVPGPAEPVTGRVESIAVSPTDPNTAYLAAAGGGVWKTGDGGTTWTPLTDRLVASGLPATLAMGALAIDPNNSNIVYAGLGEQCNCGDAVQSALGGNGLLKSLDGGTTWSLVAAPSKFSVPPYTVPANLLTFARIVVDPASAQTCGGSCGVWAATAIGLFQSTDGGVTWTLRAGGVDPATLSYLGAYDVAIATANNTTTVYASIDDFGVGRSTEDGIYTSTNGGVFSRVTSNLPSPSTAFVGRTTLAVDAQTPSTVYAAIALGTAGTPPPSGASFIGLYKTTDSGATWNLLTSCQLSSTSGPCSNYQGWYANTIAVDPTNHDLLFGATDVYRSSDGGASWSDVSQAATNGLHVDQHALSFQGGTVWSGNDGGVWRSSDDGTSWTNLNQGGLITNQFYQGGSIAPYDPSILQGGLQDNGTVFTQGGAAAWTRTTGGDGTSTAIDPRTPTGGLTAGPFYSGYVKLLDLWRVDDPVNCPGCSVDLVTGLNAAGAAFDAPFILDPAHPDHLFAGSRVVSVLTNPLQADPGNGVPANWTVLSQALTTKSISTLALASGDASGNTVYAGTSDGLIFTGTSATSQTLWSNISFDLPTGRKVTSITTDGLANPTVYATLSGFGPAIGSSQHIFKLTPGANSWTDISGNLPNAPADTIRVLGGTLYAGTDVGVFSSTNGGTTWASPASGLPFVQVTDLLLQPGPAAATTLIALTHGRGAWSFQIGGSGSVSAVTSTVQPSVQIVATNGATGTITVTLKDANGNPVPNKTVSLTPAGGASVVTAPAGTTSNAQGVVSFAVQDSTQETLVYTATETSDTPNISLTATAKVIFGAGRIGDVNGDGTVDATDALCILRFVASLSLTGACPLTPSGPTDPVWNIDGAAQIDATDALCVLRHVAALPGTLACPTFGP